MYLFDLFREQAHTINVVTEFNTAGKSEYMIASLSRYISKITRNKDTVYTDFQSFPKGYRVTFRIMYKTNFFTRKNYTKELSNLFDWMGDNKSYVGCLVRYQYTCV